MRSETEKNTHTIIKRKTEKSLEKRWGNQEEIKGEDFNLKYYVFIGLFIVHFLSLAGTYMFLIDRFRVFNLHWLKYWNFASHSLDKY